jgi:phage-related protein
MHTIGFYVKESGKCPLEDFLSSKPDKLRAKFVKQMTVLEEAGPRLGRPYAAPLGDGIFELRLVFDGSQYRAFFFFQDLTEYGILERIIITHSIAKKTQRVPRPEIDRAIRYRADHLRRAMIGHRRN